MGKATLADVLDAMDSLTDSQRAELLGRLAAIDPEVTMAVVREVTR